MNLIIRILNEADIAGRPGQYDRLKQIADDVERVIEERMAQAWDDCANESYFRGWMHDVAYEEMLLLNPHRETPDNGSGR